MHKIYLPIDTKSLYFNIYNDNLKGHTCTVATPIKQGNAVNAELNEVFKIPQQIDFEKYPDLILELNKNSKSITQIKNAFVFSKFKVNGVPINCSSKFCFFVKEEVDPQRAQYGRIKLHYPISLKSLDLNISNREVIKNVSQAVNDYAFLINGFEFDFEDFSLNFDLTIVGYNGIPYSKVFINNKGTGSKFTKKFTREELSYDSEIIAMRQLFKTNIDVENFDEFYKIGKEKAISKIKEYINKINGTNFSLISDLYPYSIYDFSYILDGVKFFGVLRYSFTSIIYADIDSNIQNFLNSFPYSKLFIITNVYDNSVIHSYNAIDLNNFSISITSLRLSRKEEG